MSSYHHFLFYAHFHDQESGVYFTEPTNLIPTDRTNNSIKPYDMLEKTVSISLSFARKTAIKKSESTLRLYAIPTQPSFSF